MSPRPALASFRWIHGAASEASEPAIGHRHAIPDRRHHVLFWIVARGINIGLQTRMYFSDEDAANAEDPMTDTTPSAMSLL